MRSQISKEATAKFLNAGYRVVGTHSGVSVCHWTKESLRRGRVCYKQKWYGIESHRCLEMTPSLVWCSHRCQFCWRNMKFTKKGEPKPDEPTAIIDGCIEARKELISGFGGREGTDRKKWEEAQKPTSAAISLAGESTMYPRISDLIGEFQKRRMTSFLVTNGTRPDRLSSLDCEPTNLYISLCAPDEATYKKVNRPEIADGWKRLNESLELMKSFECRTVLRLTLVKGLNMHGAEKYASIVKKYQPKVVEPKAFAWMGEARERLDRVCVPSMDEMRDFARQIAEKSGYEIADEDAPSKVLMLKGG